MLESKRLILRPLMAKDEAAFLLGVADRELRRMYGFPAELTEDTARRIFAHFSSLSTACSLIRKEDEALLGFLLDVPSELPEDVKRSLPEGGRTLAYATFPPFQRQGYMREALTALIGYYFNTKNTPYLHCGHFPFNEPSEKLLLSLGFNPWGQHTAGKAIILDKLLFL